MKFKEPRGFSIIELLVVIAIIALLATIGIVALNSSRAKARDAKRLSDIRQVQTALELYFSDEDNYPMVEQAIALGKGRGSKLCDAASGGFVTSNSECITEYMVQVPTDPVSGNDNLYVSTGDDYLIQFKTEKPTNIGGAGTYQATSEGISKR